MSHYAGPACEHDTDLPAKGTRVQNSSGRWGTVHDTHPVCGDLLVLWDGAMFSDWYSAREVTW